MMLYTEYMHISAFCFSIDREEDLDNYHTLFDSLQTV